MSAKQRMSVSVDAKLLKAAAQATKRGEAVTLSAWVNDAMRLKLERDRKLRGLAELIADHEKEFGPITDKDREEVARETRRRAIPVRGRRAGEARRRYGR